jgi:glycerate kinase
MAPASALAVRSEVVPDAAVVVTGEGKTDSAATMKRTLFVAASACPE